MRLKSFSIELLVASLKNTVARFPLPVLCCVVIAGLLVTVIEFSHMNEDKYHLIQIVLASSLALLLALALGLTAEVRHWSKALTWGTQLGVVALAIIYFFTLPEKMSDSIMIRHSLLALSAGSLLSLLPFAQRPMTNGYWQFNKTVVLRILAGFVFIGALFGGLAIAMFAGNQLFDLEIDGERYGQLWVVLGCLVGPLFVLAGMPKPLAALNEGHEYPKPLKAFAQYILLPLVGLYLVILYMYEIKIIAQWSWPRGWVSQLILWYSVVGLSSLLILWPLREAAENRWIKRFTTWFFFLLVPLIVMLFLAIKVRIGDYGITINRYLGVALAAWLALIVLYFIISKLKDIRAIPISIAILAIIACYGPLSAWSVSESSQVARLNNFLEQQKSPLFESQENKEKLRLRGEMSSIIEYLAQWHGVESLRGIIPDTTLAKYSDDQLNEHMDELCLCLGFQYIAHFETNRESGRFNLSTSPNSLLRLSDDSYFLQFSVSAVDERSRLIDSTLSDFGKTKGANGADTCLVDLSSDGHAVTVEVSSASFVGRDTIQLDLAKELQSRELIVERHNMAIDSAEFVGQGAHTNVRLVTQHISGLVKDGEPKIEWMSGYLVVEPKQ